MTFWHTLSWGKKTQPALFVPFSAFRHNGNVNMLNIRGLSYSLASLLIVIMSLGEGRPYFHTRGAGTNGAWKPACSIFSTALTLSTHSLKDFHGI